MDNKTSSVTTKRAGRSVPRIAVYAVLPALLSGGLVVLYFFGGLTAQRIVSPKLPPLSLDAWRELGLLENLQNVLILGMVIVTGMAAYRRRFRMERIVFAILCLFSIFILLEEIDYGTHFKAYLSFDGTFPWFTPVDQWPEGLAAQIDYFAKPFNIHNQGDLTDIIKTMVEVLMGALFVAAPFVLPRMKNAWLRYIAPDPYAVLTIAVMVILSAWTHHLGEAEEAALDAARAAGNTAFERGSINNNLSEFREISIYYLFLVYLIEIVFRRTSPAEKRIEADLGQEEHASGAE